MPESIRPFVPWWVRAHRERTSKITRGLTILCAFGLLDLALVIGVPTALVCR